MSNAYRPLDTMNVGKKLMIPADYVMGFMDWIDRACWAIQAIRHRDIGHRIRFIRADMYDGDGSPLSGNEVFRILKDYGIYCYGKTFDGYHIHISVKHNQANWAEYVLMTRMPSEQLITSTKRRGKNEGAAKARASTPIPKWKDGGSTATKRQQGTNRATGVDGLIDRLFS